MICDVVVACEAMSASEAIEGLANQIADSHIDHHGGELLISVSRIRVMDPGGTGREYIDGFRAETTLHEVFMPAKQTDTRWNWLEVW